MQYFFFSPLDTTANTTLIPYILYTGLNIQKNKFFIYQHLLSRLPEQQCSLQNANAKILQFLRAQSKMCEF